MRRQKIIKENISLLEKIDLSGFMDAFPLAIVTLDRDGRVIKWNSGAEKMFGWKESEVLGELNPILPEEFSETYSGIRARLLGGNCFTGEEFLRKKKDGTRISVKSYSALIKNEQEEVIGIIAIYENITSKLEAERKLIDNETFYRQIIESAGKGFYVIEKLSGKVVYSNIFLKKFWNLTGLDDQFSKGLMNHKELVQICSNQVSDPKSFVKSLTGSLPAKANINGTFELLNGRKGKFTISEFQENNNKNRNLLYIFEELNGVGSHPVQSGPKIYKDIPDLKRKFIFASPAMKKISYEISRLANFDLDVLLVGETGAGKDMIASEIHNRSKRAKYPFITIPLRTISDTLIESELFGHEKGAFSGADRTVIGKFEAADKGTIYIPEISSLSESMQLKLLYFMQYKKIARVGQDARKGEISLDIRLIMASNEDLEELLLNNVIRKDFYYRISGTMIEAPPLRERVEDIEILAGHFLELYSSSLLGEKLAFGKGVIELLSCYGWPGNVRELSNCIRTAVSYCNTDTIMIKDIKHLLKGDSASKEKSEDPALVKYDQAESGFKIRYLSSLLKKTNNNITEAAKLAGLTPQGLRKILKKHVIPLR